MAAPAPVTGKRKAPEQQPQQQEAQDGGSNARKRRKAAHKKKHQIEDDGDLDMEAGLNKAFERLDGQLLADHIAQRTTRFGTDLSSVELADLYISANAVKDTSSWQKPRTLENLPDFLENFAEEPKKLYSAPKKNGSPHTIIVTGAGLRAADIVRSVRKFQKKDNTVAKLFAKHIKLEEAVSFLNKSRTGIAVGTPARLMDLLDNGALSVENLKRIVVDASHIDQKKRGVMDMKETMIPLAKWLSRTEFKEKYTASENQVHLMFY